MVEAVRVSEAGRLSNWGRWGEGDERGTLNHVDAATVVEAARLVRSGRVYPLAIPIAPRYSSPVRDGALHVSSVRQDPTASRRQVSTDVMAVHTHDFTHLDALAHVGYDGLLYNGVDASTVQDKGAPTNSIAAVGAVVSRAILADVAKLEQVQSLPPGFVITPQHLDSALDAAGVEPRRGDVLLVRTGWISQYLDDRHVAAQGWPGLGTATVDWLFEHEVCAVGADNLAVEVKPFEDEEKSFLVHEHFIRDMGGYLIEFLDLEKLAEDEVYESLFVLAPLRLEGGLGSPVTPVAIG